MNGQLVIANETGNNSVSERTDAGFECERGLCTSERSSDWHFRNLVPVCPIGTCAMVLAKFWVEAVSVSQWQGH